MTAFPFGPAPAEAEVAPSAPRPRPNWLVLACAAALLAVGVLFVRSACSIRTGRVHDLWKDMLFVWIPLGAAAHVAIARLDPRKWLHWSWIPYLGALVLLLLVFVPGIGTTSNMGARRWIFGLFQPAELAKVALVPALAFLLAGDVDLPERKRFWAALAAAAVPALLIVKQPDLGTALPFGAAALAMVYVSGLARKTLLALVLVLALAATVFLAAILVPENLPPERKARVEKVTDRFVFGHWKDRILVFFYPDRDPLGAGWNKRQSEIAVGSGGRWGKGYGQGIQNALGYLPASVSSSDFIFSVIAEETGFAGSAALLALYAGLLAGILATGFAARDPACRLMCAGVAAVFFTHVFVNIAMTVGIAPITGIPLPLVSYGGTFAVSSLALLGIVQGVAIHNHRSDEPQT